MIRLYYLKGGDIMEEKYKDIYIKDIPTNYQVSTLGYVRNKITGKILVPEVSKNGYYRVGLYYRDKNGTLCHKKYSVHRLVAIAFIPNPENLPEVNHKDGRKYHNYVHNLEWMSSSENDYHAYRTGLKRKKYDDSSHLHVYSCEAVIAACKLMESGEYTTVEISSITGISNSMLRRIYHGKSWCNISQKYHIERCKMTEFKNDGSRYTKDQIEKVFKLLEENTLSIYDISDQTDVTTSTITNILNHRSGLQQFEYMYSKYDIKKYSGRKPVLHPLTTEVKQEISDLLKDGYDKKAVINFIHETFGYNLDYIRHYINRNFN